MLLPEAASHDEVIFPVCEVPTAVAPAPPPPRLMSLHAHAPGIFVGRNWDIYRVIVALAEGARAVTLTGPPMVGKTCVALRAAQYAAGRALSARGSVPWEPSSGVASIAVVPGVSLTEAVANALRVYPGDLLEYMRPRSFLLLFDGVLPDTAANVRSTAGAIASASVGTRIIVTCSRDSYNGLWLRGEPERVVELEGLQPEAAALLFARAAPRPLTMAEMGAPDGGMPAEVIRAFADSPLIQGLMGMPAAVLAAAARLAGRGVTVENVANALARGREHDSPDMGDAKTGVVTESAWNDRPGAAAGGADPPTASHTHVYDARPGGHDLEWSRVDAALMVWRAYGHRKACGFASAQQLCLEHAEDASARACRM